MIAGGIPFDAVALPGRAVREIDRLQPLLPFAGLKIGVAVVALAASLTSPAGGVFAPLVWLAQIAALAAAGTLLLVGGRHDRRAVYLGYACLLLAAALAPGDTRGLHQRLAWPWSSLLFAAANLRIEVFLAPLLALFARDFPSTPLSLRWQSRVDRLIRWSWYLAAALLALHLAWLAPAAGSAAAITDGRQDDPTYLPSALAVLALALAALVLSGWKAHRSVGEEKRRGRLFMLAVVAGGAVLAAAALVSLLAGREGFEVPAEVRWPAQLAVHAVLLAIPFTIAYSVLVEHVLDVRGLARNAVQHTLTRTTARLVVAAPFAVLALYLFKYRHLSLVELFSARHLLLAALAAVGVAGLRYRRPMLEAIDRHFFPEQFNARRVLDQLPGQIRGARDLDQLAALLVSGVGLAWRLEQAGVLVRDPELRMLVDPRQELPPLELDTQLAGELAARRRPVEVDLASESSPWRELPEGERHWLVDGRGRLLAPTLDTDKTLNGLLVLGAKQSDLPYQGEDLELVGDVASSAGLIIEILELRRREAGGAPSMASDEILSSSRKAAECLSCGRVYPAGTPRCGKCDLELAEASVPYALRRMFRFEERIGTGGMAVVYRATDLKLGRPVAIKTLPRVSPEAAARLQQEARTAATVSHPGLAAIYGIETWEGIPMLILEYLEGGTLSGRLTAGRPVSVAEMIETGQLVAEALEVLHTFGILHRDVKPSNVGYTRHGTAKLLDFGIARIYQDLRRDDEDPSEVLTIDGRLTGQPDNVSGTLCYFSPEALDEESPDPTFDLWSLTVVLYEALTARNLFYRPRLKEMLEAIRRAEVPDPCALVPGCPPELAEFFALELNPDRARRSQSGSEFSERLEKIRRALPPAVRESGGTVRGSFADAAS